MIYFFTFFTYFTFKKWQNVSSLVTFYLFLAWLIVQPAQEIGVLECFCPTVVSNAGNSIYSTFTEPCTLSSMWALRENSRETTGSAPPWKIRMGIFYFFETFCIHSATNGYGCCRVFRIAANQVESAHAAMERVPITYILWSSTASRFSCNYRAVFSPDKVIL